MKIKEKEIKVNVRKLNERLKVEKLNKQYQGKYYEEVDGKLVLRNTEEQNANSTF